VRISPRESATQAPADAARASPATLPSPGEERAPAFADVLRRLGRDIDDGERTMRRAMAAWAPSSEWDAGDLLALQAGAYRYSEILDVASRFVDRTASGVKTILQGTGQ
jgi:hypothetical protein